MSAQPCTACNGTGEVEREVNRVVYRFGQEFEEDVVVRGECDQCEGEGVCDADVLAWEQQTTPAPKLPRVTQFGDMDLIEDEDGWGRPVRYTRTREEQ